MPDGAAYSAPIAEVNPEQLHSLLKEFPDIFTVLTTLLTDIKKSKLSEDLRQQENHIANTWLGALTRPDLNTPTALIDYLAQNLPEAIPKSTPHRTHKRENLVDTLRRYIQVKDPRDAILLLSKLPRAGGLRIFGFLFYTYFSSVMHVEIDFSATKQRFLKALEIITQYPQLTSEPGMSTNRQVIIATVWLTLLQTPEITDASRMVSILEPVLPEQIQYGAEKTDKRENILHLIDAAYRQQKEPNWDTIPNVAGLRLLARILRQAVQTRTHPSSLLPRYFRHTSFR